MKLKRYGQFVRGINEYRETPKDFKREMDDLDYEYGAEKAAPGRPGMRGGFGKDMPEDDYEDMAPARTRPGMTGGFGDNMPEDDYDEADDEMPMTKTRPGMTGGFGDNMPEDDYEEGDDDYEDDMPMAGTGMRGGSPRDMPADDYEEGDDEYDKMPMARTRPGMGSDFGDDDYGADAGRGMAGELDAAGDKYDNSDKLADLAEMLGVEVRDNQVKFGDQTVNYYSETGNLHIGSKEFETAEDAAEFLRGGKSRMVRDTNESRSYRFRRRASRKK